jgi:hypothetical protein
MPESDRVLVHAEQTPLELQVLGRSQRVVDARRLGHVARQGARGGRSSERVVATDLDRPAVR